MKTNSKNLKGALLASTVMLMPAVVYAQQAEQADPGQDIEEVTVMGQYIPDEKRATSEISNILDGADFSRLGDSDIASSLKRLTGLSLDTTGVVIVRGLADRYSSALLDGAHLPSPMPLRRVTPLDLFPTSFLEGVLVQKTYSPQYPGQFGGGLIELRSKAVPEEDFFEIGISGSYNTESTFEDGLSYDFSDTDWLGFDDGLRDLPDAIAANPTLEGMTDAELEAAGEAIPNIWSIDLQENLPDFGFDVNLGKRIEMDDSSLGILLAVSYDNEYRNEFGERRSFTNTSSGLEARDNQSPEVCEAYPEAPQTCGVRSTKFEADLNGILSIGYEFGGNNNVKFTSMILRTSTREARIQQGEFASDPGELRSYSRIDWIERQVWTNQLSGEHYFDVMDTGETEVKWRAVRSKADRDVPMRKEYYHDFDLGFESYLLSTRADGNRISWGELNDKTSELGFDVKQPVELGDIAADIRVGGMYFKKERESDFLRYGFDFPSGFNAELRSLVPEIAIGSFNIAPDGFVLTSFVDPSDSYDGSEELFAGYAAIDAQLSEQFRLAAGFRYEDSQQIVNAFTRFTGEPIDVDLDESDFLPAATLTWTFVENMQLRLGYSKTLSRPDLRELAPVTFLDEDGRRSTGNENLQIAKIDNIDLRWEWYFGEDEYITIGGFYKDFSMPIETNFTVLGEGIVRSWENAEAGEAYGVEVEAQLNIPMEEVFEGEFFANRLFYVKANGAYIKSEVSLNEEQQGQQTDSVRAMQGQSEWLGNLILGWDGEDDRMTILLNYTGDRISEVGLFQLPNRIEEPPLLLDFVYKHDIAVAGGEMELSFKVENILNDEYVVYQGDQIAERYDIGTTFTVGVKQRF
ncbi:TonB-dependent receptor domain-containing protein [Emcibacter sp.]|uniref:TonB-dependent receptor domain-containing protein n=1 Tax=Emcibacter sp. TaxID=1979954 RepID=UPI003A8EB19D